MPMSHRYMDFHESFSISGYESHMLAATRPELAPKWLNLCNYYIYTAFCCTVRRFQPETDW